MCGIVGYIGKNNAIEPVIHGLKALEYRGYDSAGMAVVSNNKPVTIKQVGRVEALENELKQFGKISANIAIGHTRWATHGVPSIVNAHPHYNTDKTIFVVHNGIIENYQTIRTKLQKAGYIFLSETDTEVIPHLIDFYLKSNVSFAKAFRLAIKDLKGAYAIGAIHSNTPDTLYVARLSSPLVIGVGNGEHFLASDATAIMKHTKKVIYLDDYEIAEIRGTDVKIHDIQKEIAVRRAAEDVEIESAEAELGDYPDYMNKEIHEAPQTVRSAMLGRVRVEENLVRLGGLSSVKNQLRYIDRIVIIACGTSYYAGMVGEYLIEELAEIPVEVQQASEFRYRNEPLTRSTAVLVVSQSGETADAIAALKKLDGSGILTLGVVNAPGSTLARMTDAGVYCHAGPEKAVASTKAFIAQVTVLCLIGLYLSKNYPDFSKLLRALDALPKQLEAILDLEPAIKKIAKKYAKSHDFLYIGRRYLYPVALEGALKIKEISYIHAEGFAGGEMKHGPLALIEKDFPTFALALSSGIAEKSASNMQEIKSRGGPIIAVVDDAKSEAAKLADDVIVIPKTLEQLQPILAATATHLFAYHAAKQLGRDIDKPRNLAKSVTVE